MGVFLRWGVFGIVAIAALMYAYNASKRMAEHRQSVVSAAPQTADDVEEPAEDADATGEAGAGPDLEMTGADEQEPEPQLPEVCTEELRVAERALKMRRDGEPLDRLLRIEAIAFKSDPARRARLEAVVTAWFEREGRDPTAAMLRGEVARDCLRVNPAP